MKEKNMKSFFFFWWVGNFAGVKVKSGEGGVMEYHSFSTFFFFFGVW